MAVVANFDATAASYQVYLDQARDFDLAKAKRLPSGCTVGWRPDSLELAVVQADDCAGRGRGLARIDAPTRATRRAELGGDARHTSRSSRRSRSVRRPGSAEGGRALPGLPPPAQPAAASAALRRAARRARRRRSSSCCPTARASRSSTT